MQGNYVQLPDDAITRFKGQHQFLSNFYRVRVEWEGVEYPTLEHAYQAVKTVNMTWREKIRNADTPGQAKSLGRRVPLVMGWDNLRLIVMEELLRNKFDPAHHMSMTHLLTLTGDRMLVDGNDWGDRFWGMEWHPMLVGTGTIADPQVPGGWVGENWLGKLLMKIRKEL